MKIGFIGAGKMGEAYIGALSQENEIYFYEVDQNRKKYIEEKYNVEAVEKIESLVNGVDYVVLAVKPNIMEIVIDEIRKSNIIKLEPKVFVSIAAGVKISSFEKWFDSKGIKLVRVMPNTPCLIKKGISAYTANQNISKKDLSDIEDILKATGEIIPAKEEELDLVTAISGSGPAYVLLMINSIADAGVRFGLKKDMALRLATETFLGTAELLKQSQDHPEKLKDNVTSPGGTTAAGLAKLEEKGVRNALMQTVEAAYIKAKQLGKGE